MNYMMLLGQEKPAQRVTGVIHMPEEEKRTASEKASSRNKERGEKNRAIRENKILKIVDIDCLALSEIATRLGVIRQTAAEDLERMEAKKLIRSRKIGTQLYYWRPAR